MYMENNTTHKLYTFEGLNGPCRTCHTCAQKALALGWSETAPPFTATERSGIYANYHCHTCNERVFPAKDRIAYTVDLPVGAEDTTMDWLAQHGYDAGFLEHAATWEVAEDDSYTRYNFTEQGAWAVLDLFHDDAVAFLSCCGHAGIAAALYKFLDEIV